MVKTVDEFFQQNKSNQDNENKALVMGYMVLIEKDYKFSLLRLLILLKEEVEDFVQYLNYLRMFVIHL